MYIRPSSNPEARLRTLDLLHEHGEKLTDWIDRLKNQNGLSEKQIMEHAVHRGFIDEEIEGCIRELTLRYGGDTVGDCVLDALTEIWALPEKV